MATPEEEAKKAKEAQEEAARVSARAEATQTAIATGTRTPDQVQADFLKTAREKNEREKALNQPAVGTPFPNNLRPNGSLLTGDISGNSQTAINPENMLRDNVVDGMLRDRQNLASEIKGYVDKNQKISPEDATRMLETGSDLELKSSDLSNLYRKYKADQPKADQPKADQPKAVEPSRPLMSETSTSSLNQGPRSLGTQSGAMRREARRLRRDGYFGEAGQMAGAASMQRLNEPTVLTQAQRGRMDVQSKQADRAGQEAAALQGEYTQFMREAIKKRREDLES